MTEGQVELTKPMCVCVCVCVCVYIHIHVCVCVCVCVYVHTHTHTLQTVENQQLLIFKCGLPPPFSLPFSKEMVKMSSMIEGLKKHWAEELRRLQDTYDVQAAGE